LEDRELNGARSKPDTVDRPVRTARTFVCHYNSTHGNTETVFLLIFLQTNGTIQLWCMADGYRCTSHVSKVQQCKLVH